MTDYSELERRANEAREASTVFALRAFQYEANPKAILGLLSELSKSKAKEERTRDALTEICAIRPATCDVTLAHAMSDVADAALKETNQ